MAFRRTRIVWLLACALAGLGGYVWVTSPASMGNALADFDPLAMDPDRGAEVAIAAGCAGCHQDPDDDRSNLMAGGLVLASPFGRFHVPNITPDPVAGIGVWTFEEFARALRNGVSPTGEHYFPSFPYSAYQGMSDQDLGDLWAYWQSLPPSSKPSQPHELDFPFSIRRNVGIWKTLALPYDFPITSAGRGAYLVQYLGHCAECHTARNALGALKMSKWMRGAQNPSGKGRIPSIHPDDLGWSAQEIAAYLETGFTPDYDVAGGHMAKVIKGTAQLTTQDRDAIAQYLLALP